MTKFTLLILGSLCLINIPVHADSLIPGNTTANHKEEKGLGMGAIIGGLIAGPPGAIIGAAGGAWFGHRARQKDIELTYLEQGISDKQGEIAYLQTELKTLQHTFGERLHRVKAEKRLSTLEDLSQGVSLTVYFRTDSAGIDTEFIPRIEKLADFIKGFPEIQLHLEAHTDRRGYSNYNKSLSWRRAQTVSQELVKAGVNPARIHTHAYGESGALAAPGDIEGYGFDRRVNIHLTLNTEI